MRKGKSWVTGPFECPDNLREFTGDEEEREEDGKSGTRLQVQTIL